MSAPSRPGAPRSSARTSTHARQRPGARKAKAPTPASSRTSGSRTSGSRTAGSRPGGPSGPGRSQPVAKPRIDPARIRGSWTAMLSWRTAVIAGVVMLAIALLMPSLRVYFEQQQQLQELRSEAAGARTEVDELEGQVARWEDPSFLVAQARERLAYVFPGETPYRVIDPETVEDDTAVAADATGDPAEILGNTWYDTLWGSVLLAGEGPVEIVEPVAPVEEEPADDSSPLTDVDFGG